MSSVTTRRTAIAAGLSLALVRGRVARTGQLGQLESDAQELDWLPALPEDAAAWPVSILTHADLAEYWEAAGVAAPRAFNDETSERWIDIGHVLPVNDGIMYQYLAAEDWGALVGFDLWDVDQLTVFGEPPDQIRLYRGRFDPGQIATTLGDADYDLSSDGEVMLISKRSDDLDPTNDLDRLALGNLNYVAVQESLVIATRSREARDAAMAAGFGDTRSLFEQESGRHIVGLIAPMTGYLLLNGNVLRSGGPQNGEPIRGPSLPPARFLVAGITVAENGQVVSLIADLGDSAAAEEAVDVIAGRIETMSSPISLRPYLEDLEGFAIDAIPDTALVRVNLTNDIFAMRWMRYVFAADLTFLATE